MSGYSEMCEIIPGLILGSVADAGKMVRYGADVLVPLAYLDGSIWNTGFRGEILYYPIVDRNVLPVDVLHDLVDKICDRLEEGKKVGLFCAGGHGRTGYVAACVLARHGIRDPIAYIRRDYSSKAIETDEQANVVFTYMRSLRAEQIRSEGLGPNFFEHRPYRGQKPYIYLSFSEWDADIASETVSILNEMGFHVSYDRMVLDGVLWSGSRSDKIEDCSLYVTLETPCERFSHIRYAADSFAELLEIPYLAIETNEKYWEYCSEDGDTIATKPDEPDFAKKCLEAFARKGMTPDTSGEEEQRPRSFKKRKDRKWDLAITYYENYLDDQRWFKHEHERTCNIRTREVTSWHGGKLEDASDEEMYRAIGWKRIRFDLLPRSSRMDRFLSMDEDRKFRERLCTLGGRAVPEIQEEYRKDKKKMDDFWRDYPYMDEFEYVDSKFDERSD